MAEELTAHLRQIIHDPVHFPARWLRQLQRQTGGIDTEVLAGGIAAVTALCLLQDGSGRFLGNGILTAVPIILTYVYPKERPPVPHLLIYWAVISLATLLDDAFDDTFPAYYVFKLILIAILFLKPINGAAKILEMIEKSRVSDAPTEDEQHAFNDEELQALEKAKSKKSPPPEKPEGETSSNVKSTKTFGTATKTNTTGSSVSSVRSKPPAKSQIPVSKREEPSPAASPIPTPPQEKPRREDSSRQTSMYLPTNQEGSVAKANNLRPIKNEEPKKQSQYLAVNAPATSPAKPELESSNSSSKKAKKPTPTNNDSSRQTKQSLYLPVAGEGGSVTKANNAAIVSKQAGSPVDTKGSIYMPVTGQNPMTTDRNYALTPNTTASSTSTTSIEAGHNLNDLIFSPSSRIIFNAPFDDRALTYHMTVQNNSKHWIAFAIKSNGIPRLTANPPSGILKPGEKHMIAVTVQKFVYDDVDVSKDRIAFDYVFCPDGTKAFAHSLLQGMEARRRKNIKVVYNP